LKFLENESSVLFLSYGHTVYGNPKSESFVV